MNNVPIEKGPFQPTFESLRAFTCPAWFRDAKLGIWSHWGAQSVPMYGDWYARNMYIEGSDDYLYHCRHYGHPSRFGYKDIAELWKAENFDPEELMALYKKAGAKYFVAQAMHHDHFFNYASKLHRFNSVEMGPHRDIVGLWQKAAQKQGLPFGLSEHLGATFSWWRTNKGSDKQGPFAGVPYDGNDPDYEDLYLPNREHYDPDDTDPSFLPWYTSNTAWHERWLAVMRELIDLYRPDLLYSDGPLPFDEGSYGAGLAAVAHLYNTSAAMHGGVNQAVYNQKDRRREVYSVGVLDIERSQTPDIKPEPWQTDTCLGEWFYDVKARYKKPGHVIELLVDIVAKNGNLLLNVPQKPDGTIDVQCRYLLERLAEWNRICGEGIFGTPAVPDSRRRRQRRRDRRLQRRSGGVERVGFPLYDKKECFVRLYDAHARKPPRGRQIADRSGKGNGSQIARLRRRAVSAGVGHSRCQASRTNADRLCKLSGRYAGRVK